MYLSLQASPHLRALQYAVLVMFGVVSSLVSDETDQSTENPYLDMDLDQLANLEVIKTGMLGSHTHFKGQWMIGHEQTTMRMEGSLNGSHDAGKSEVLRDFMITPLNMTMVMDMFTPMYAHSDAWTFMVMIPYVRKSMDHINRAGKVFTTRSEGLGDISLMAMNTLVREDNHDQIFMTYGLGLPTGSYDKKDHTPLGYQQLPYPMQIGSGTYSILLGGTAIKNINENVELGLKVRTRRYIGKNDNSYRLGDTHSADVWSTFKVREDVALVARIQGKNWRDIEGRDPLLNAAMVPTADPHRRGGKRVNLMLEANFRGLGNDFRGHLISIAMGYPISQSLEGPQLALKKVVKFGWMWTF